MLLSDKKFWIAWYFLQNTERIQGKERIQEKQPIICLSITYSCHTPLNLYGKISILKPFITMNSNNDLKVDSFIIFLFYVIPELYYYEVQGNQAFTISPNLSTIMRSKKKKPDGVGPHPGHNSEESMQEPLVP